MRLFVVCCILLGMFARHQANFFTTSVVTGNSSAITLTVKENDSVRLNCTGCSGTWKSPLPSNQISSTGEIYEVRHAQYSDRGYYSCNDCVYFVDVQVPPRADSDPASFVFWCTVREESHSCLNSTIFSRCPVFGNPPPKVKEWTLVTSARKRNCTKDCPRHIFPENSSLIFDAADCYYGDCKLFRSVPFNCTASNALGSVTVPVTVNLEYVDSLPDIFASKPDNVTEVNSGQPVNLIVEANAPHDTDVVWLKDGIDIRQYNQSDHYHVIPPTKPYQNSSYDDSGKADRLQSTLLISDASSSDEGNYTWIYSLRSKTISGSTQLKILQSFPLWGSIVLAVAGVIIACIISGVLCFRRFRKNSHLKEKDKIKGYFLHEFYISCSLCTATWTSQGKIQMSKNCSSFYEKVLRPVLKTTKSESHNTHALDCGRRGSSLGCQMDDVSADALDNSWKMILLVDGDEEEGDDLSWQQSEINRFKESIVSLDAEKNKIEPVFVVVQLGSSERKKSLDLGSYEPLELDARNFGRNFSNTVMKMKDAILHAREAGSCESPFIWNVTVFGCVLDKDDIFHLLEIIRKSDRSLVCESFTYSVSSLQKHGMETRRIAAYSQVVVAFVSQNYLNYMWEDQQQIVKEGRFYIPVIHSGIPLSSIPKEISKKITCINKDGKDFESRLLQGIATGRSKHASSHGTSTHL